MVAVLKVTLKISCEWNLGNQFKFGVNWLHLNIKTIKCYILKYAVDSASGNYIAFASSELYSSEVITQVF